MAWYLTSDGDERECAVLDRSGSLVCVQFLDTRENEWVGGNDVDHDGLDRWDWNNSQFGVGA